MKVYAVVKVTIEIPLQRPWDDTWAIRDIDKQAKDEVVETLRRGLVVNGMINNIAEIKHKQENVKPCQGIILETEVKKVIVKE